MRFHAASVSASASGDYYQLWQRVGAIATDFVGARYVPKVRSTSMSMHDEIERGAQPDEVERYRSTPLRPAVWMTGVLVWATVVALFLRVPTWAGVFLCVLTGISFVVFLVAYIYLFVSDPEMLRAERYRGRKRRSSGREVERQQAWELSQDRRRYLGPETRSVVALPDEGEPHANVVKSSGVIEE